MRIAVAASQLPVCGMWKNVRSCRTPSAHPRRKQSSATQKKMTLQAAADSARDERGTGSEEFIALLLCKRRSTLRSIHFAVGAIKAIRFSGAEKALETKIDNTTLKLGSLAIHAVH